MSFTDEWFVINSDLGYTYADIGFESAIHTLNERYKSNQEPTEDEIKQFLHAGVVQLYLKEFDPLHYAMHFDLHENTVRDLKQLPAIVARIKEVENEEETSFYHEVNGVQYFFDF